MRKKAHNLKIAAISRMNSPFHMDHLLPLCDLLQAKFVTCEDSHYELAQKFYPPQEMELVDSRFLSTEYVKEFYDIIIHSFSWPKKLIDYELMPEKKESKKQLRCLHTPHGNSDKGYHSGIMTNYVHQDICLLYGGHMVDMLKSMDIFDSLKDPVLIGNVRYPYYVKHKAFFDQIADEQVFSKLNPHKKTILYAPTWDDYEQSTSVYEAYNFVLEHLPAKYNVIVKLHPWLIDYAPGKMYHIIGKYENTPNLVFLTEYPPVYPLLARSDIYLGDFSSIGYDFLAFNRPMFFFNPLRRDPSDKSLFLHQCGTEIPLSEGKSILEILENGLREDARFQDKRREVYHYAFGEEKNPESLREEILTLCRKTI